MIIPLRERRVVGGTRATMVLGLGVLSMIVFGVSFEVEGMVSLVLGR